MNGVEANHTIPKDNLRATRIIFTVLTSGVLIFSVIVFFIFRSRPAMPEDETKRQVLSGIAALLAFICLVAAILGHRKGLAKAANLTGSLNDKLNYHRSLLIRYLALCEGPAIFGAVMYIFSREIWLLAVPAVMLAAMFRVNPGRDRVAAELQLDSGEKMQLE